MYGEIMNACLGKNTFWPHVSIILANLVNLYYVLAAEKGKTPVVQEDPIVEAIRRAINWR